LASVLPEGERQLIRRASNASGGGSTEEVTDLMHPDNVLICELAARTVGLDIAGIDLVVRDVSESVLETGGGVLEINSGPGLIDHLKPGSGTPRDVGGAILDMLYPRGARTGAPIVAVFEDDGEAALAHALRRALVTHHLLAGVLTGGRITIRDTSLSLPYCDFGIVGAAAISPDVRHALRSIPTPESGWIAGRASGPLTKKLEGEQVILPAGEIPEYVASALAQLLSMPGSRRM
jgi:hypothetical protein